MHDNPALRQDNDIKQNGAPPKAHNAAPKQDSSTQYHAAAIGHQTAHDSAMPKEIGEMIIRQPLVDAMLNQTTASADSADGLLENLHSSSETKRLDVLDLSPGPILPGQYISTHFQGVTLHTANYRDSGRALCEKSLHDSHQNDTPLSCEPSKAVASETTGSYDMLISINDRNDGSSVHCRSMNTLLREARTVLRPGGIVVSNTNVESFEAEKLVDLLASFGLILVPSSGAPFTFHHCARDTLQGSRAHHLLLLAQKPVLEINLPQKFQLSFKLFVHPHVSILETSAKGRHMVTTAHIRAGTVLTIEKGYAVVPWKRSTPFLMCNFHACNQVLSQNTNWIDCDRKCINRVVWCSRRCQELDRDRHQFECTWLAVHAADLSREHGSYKFDLVWLIVRILARRYFELGGVESTGGIRPALDRFLDVTSGSDDWKDIWNLCDNRDLLDAQDRAQWTQLLSTYIEKCTSRAASLPVQDLVLLMGKIGQNAFALISRKTELSPPLARCSLKDGDIYGIGLFYRSGLYNHSCFPNVSDRSDLYGRTVLFANRDIHAGEECCITYIGSSLTTVEERRKYLKSSYNFDCSCDRCEREKKNAQETESSIVTACENVKV